MRTLILAALPLLLLCGCASGPPARAPGWWTQHVHDQRPELETDAGMFYGSGEANRAASIEDNDPLEFKWSCQLHGAPQWALHARPDGTGTIVSYETWASGSVLRAAWRRLEFQLDADEQRKLRQALRDSGVLNLQTSFGGGGERTWLLGIRAGDTLVGIKMTGGFPAEAKRAVQGAWDVIVKPRAELLRKAERYEADREGPVPEYQPLR